MTVQMTTERMEAYVEVIEVLKYMDDKYVDKIPKKLRDFFEENSSKDYVFHLNTNKPLNEQNLKQKTLCILEMLNLSYWCESEEAKKILLEKYYEEEKLYQQELREKYNPDNIFKKQHKDNKIEEKNTAGEVAIIEYKESIFKKIVNKIKSWFNR